MYRTLVGFALTVGLGALLGVVSLATLMGMASAQDQEPQAAVAMLRNQNGEDVGTVAFSQQAGKVLVHAQVWSLPEGFHGFHVHGVGACTGDFTSAGSHLNPGGHTHPGHHGDLPILLVNADGTATMSILVDRLSIADLKDADGSAVIIHADPDNYGNIPSRYAAEPDATTLGTGDAGARIACGVVN
jgi:superoxide dismutase, Cu-Zn family